ncbi:MAG: glycosyltransferase [Oscillospiraceae bacterium]|nr:glycosyltransferase [Oscillospiraceae bacterium]
MKICAIIVTYNRKELVKECLSAVLNQTYPIHDILLFDNGSTDGTHDFLDGIGLLCDSRIHYTYVENNIGAAGAYSEAFNIAKSIECDWIWEMDDDTIPNPDCLERLLGALDVLSEEKSISFLASTVFGENGEFMNVPAIDARPSENGYPSWYKYLNRGIVKIGCATFISLLFNKKAVDQIGIPIREFSMWGFDTEYTRRLTKYFGDAYFVGDSVAIHKRKNAIALNIEKETEPDRIKLYRTLYESSLINSYLYAWNRSNSKLYLYAMCKILKSLKYLRKENGEIIFREHMIGALKALKDRKMFEVMVDAEIERKNE